MKRFYLLILFVFAAVICQARIVPREEAALRAAALFRTARPAGVGSLNAEPVLVRASKCTYIFENEGGGYAIVAADDVASPILGYSLEGRFPVDDIPVNLQSLLDWYDRIIAYASEQGWESVSNGTDMPGEAADTEVKLKTARWGQGTPFNDLSPVVDGRKCPSGCVATAQAIIMKYYNYPDHGTGVLPDYDYGWDNQTGGYKYHIKGYALGHTYDWENMPEGSSGYTEYQAAQIAQLLYDIGVMSEMDFGPDGSGASTMSPLKLVTYFGYDKSMRYFRRSFFSTSQWEQMIRDEIDAGRPVFHCGFNPDGGHAFVMDGYKGRYFSINFGWSCGSAWYLISPIAGHEKDLTEFYDGQDLVCRIMPDAGGEPYTNLCVPDSYLPFRWNFEDKTIWGGWFWLWNYSMTDTVVELAYGLFDSDDRFKEILSETVRLRTDTDYVPEMTITLPKKIADGDCILLARREGGKWTPLAQSRQSYIRFNRSRKLSEMVSVGHSFGPPDNYDPSGKPTVFFDVYKDVWWTVTSEYDGTVVLESSYGTYSHKDTAVRAAMTDSETGMARFECRLPEGTYRLTLRNFDDTFTITFTL